MSQHFINCHDVFGCPSLSAFPYGIIYIYIYIFFFTYILKRERLKKKDSTKKTRARKPLQVVASNDMQPMWGREIVFQLHPLAPDTLTPRHIDPPPGESISSRSLGRFRVDFESCFGRAQVHFKIDSKATQNRLNWECKN